MKIDHIAIYVCDLEGARNFFVTYFGAKSNEGYHNKRTGFSSFFLSFDDDTRLELMTKPEIVDRKKEPNRTGFAHLSFSVGSKERVDALTAQLKDNGFVREPQATAIMKVVLWDLKTISLRLPFK